MSYSKAFLEGDVPETLKMLNHLANTLPVEKLVLEVTETTKLIKQAREQGSTELASILTYWRSLFIEALERRNKFAYHCWMARVMSDAVDPAPFFCPPKEDGQTPKNEAGHEETQENCPASTTQECP